MIGKKMEKALNDQVNAELHSAYIYLAMAAYFESKNLKGFANWMHKQYNEEVGHAMKFFNFIVERGGRVQLQKIDEPPTDWDSALAAFEAAYKHEVYISGRIHDLVKLSAEENDLPAHYFLAWFVDEQVEEESSTDEVVQHLKMVGDSKGGLFMLDSRLGKRGQD